MKTTIKKEVRNARTETTSPDLSTPPPGPPAEGEIFERYGIFSHFEIRKTSRIRRGYVTCLFSSGELDLREAEVEGELELDVRVLFSSLEVEVPKTWEVVVDVHPIFGSTELKGRGEGTAAHAPTLRVRGICLFGSIEVKRKHS